MFNISRKLQPRWLLRWWRVPLLALVLLLALVGYVSAATDGARYADPQRVPPARVAIVFGAGVRPDGTPSPMLADRVLAATRLYQTGRVRKLLLTGDNGRPDYNEVAAMRRLAMAHGVPAGDITLDYAGFSTYESCYRARAIFGVTQAVLVTQQFHLPRAIYTCRQQGIEAVGLGTPDWGLYSDALMWRYTVREALATLNALWQVHVTQPAPTYLGRFEGIA